MSAYSTAVLADSPVVFLQLDELSGTSAADSGSNATAWTYQAGVTLAQTPVFADGGKSVLASGTAAAAILSSVPASLAAVRGTSIEVSVNLPNTSQKGAIIQIGAATNGWSFGPGSSGSYVNAGNNLCVILDGVANYDSGAAIGTGSHLLTVTMSSTGLLSFYIDGALRSQTGTATPITATTQMNLGGYSTFNVANTVNLDNLSLYSTTLSQAQVAAHWEAIQTTLSATPVQLSFAAVEALTIPTATPRALSGAYVEAVTTPTVVPRALSNAYVEAMTIPTATPRALSGAYLEVLSSNAVPQFTGWGVPL